MEKDEFIEELGIKGEQSFADDGSLVVQLTEDNWGQVQSLLDDPARNQGLEPDEDYSFLESNMESRLQYSNDYFIVTLIFNLETNKYRLEVKDI